MSGPKVTGPKTTDVGTCELLDNNPNSRLEELAPSYVENKAIDAVGCDPWDINKKKEPFRAKACSVVRDAITTVADHPVFKSVVTYFAKWRMGEYSLKKNGKEILRPESMDRSPAAIFNAHSKCVKK